MKRLFIVLTAVLFITASCATFTAPKTKSERIGYLNGLVAAFTNTAKQLLDSGRIDLKTAKIIQANIHLAAQELDLAQNSTNETRANDMIQGAAAILNSVKAQIGGNNGTTSN